MKKQVGFIILIVYIYSSLSFAFGDEDKVNFMIDGKVIEFQQEPFVKNGKMFVPLRETFELLDISVFWNENDKTIFCKKNDKEFLLRLGDNKIVVDDKDEISDLTVELINGCTYIPVCFISENFDMEVHCNLDFREIDINSCTNKENDVDFENVQLLNSANKSYEVYDDNGEILVKSEVVLEEKLPYITDYDTELNFSPVSKVSLEKPQAYIEKVQKIIRSNTISAEAYLNQELKYLGYKGIDELKNKLKISKVKSFSEFSSLDFSLNYEVNIFDNFISIKALSVVKNNQELISKRIFSKTYSIETGETVDLNNISKKIFEKDSNYILDIVKDILQKRIQADEVEFSKNALEKLDNLKEENFYFSKKGLTFFFNQNEISDDIYEFNIKYDANYPYDTIFTPYHN